MPDAVSLLQLLDYSATAHNIVAIKCQSTIFVHFYLVLYDMTDTVQ